MKQNDRTLSHVFSAFCDFVINLISVLVALLIIKEVYGKAVGGKAVVMAVGIAILTVAVYFVFDLYSTKVFTKLHRQILRILIAQLLISAATFVCLAIFTGEKEYYFVELISVGISTALVITKKIISTKLFHLLAIKRRRLRRVIIVGGSQAGVEYERELNENKHLGYHVIGTVAGMRSQIKNKIGTYSELEEIIKRENPYEIVIALSTREQSQLQGIMEIANVCGVRAVIIPTATYKYFKSKCQVDMIGNIPIINTRAVPLDNAVNAAMKRTMDIIISLVMIILTSPIMVLAFIGVKLSSKGPAIFKQKRVGRYNEQFTMYKFRSMRVNEMSDTAWTTNEDTRKTRFGTFLRKTGIDELPQLFNVLFGSMSIVGPRPELPKFVEAYSKTVPLYNVKHQVKPGITGLAQIYGYRGDTSIERRIELDIKYIETWSVYNDLKIIITTPFKMFNRNEKYVK